MTRISKKIAGVATSGKIEYIKEHICAMDEKRILAIVYSLRKSDDVNVLLRKFSDLNNEFVVETDLLEEEGKKYNKQYATDINGKFGVEYNSLYIMKCSIYTLYSLMTIYSPKRKPKTSSAVNTSSFYYKAAHSGFGTMPVQLTYVTLSNMPAAKQRLVDEIKAFLSYLDANLEKCSKIIAEEKRVGNNLDELINLLEKQIDEIFSYFNGKKSKIKNRPTFVDALINYKNDPSNVKKFFHKLNKKELRLLAECIKELEERRYFPKVVKAFEGQKDKIKLFYDAVQNLDKCVPERKISAMAIANLGRYTNWTSSNSALHESVVYIYKENGGKLEMPGRLAVNNACNNLDYKSYLKFQSKMDTARITK